MDIYTVNEELVKILVKMNKIEIFSKQFNETPENYEKVNLVEKLLIRLNLMAGIQDKIELKVSKNDETSKALRSEGNEYFSLKKRNYFKAYEAYNKSICFAKSNENLSIGYANRSAILFEWKRYTKCLENIDLARNFQYPEKLQYKLEKRELECKELLKLDPTATESTETPFELSFDSHPKVPFIASCLDMRYTKDLGRYICTNKELRPGQLISIEEDFTSCLLPAWRYLRCANCKEESLNLTPCENCSSAMFCNEKCKRNAKFHKFECSIIDLLFGIFNKIQLIALRVALTVLTLFKSIGECMQFCKHLENLNSFELNYENFSKIEYYKAIHGLVTNQEKRSTGDLFQRAVAAAVLKNYLIENSEELKTFLADQDGENFFTNLLFKYLQTSPSNFHSIELIENKKNEESNEQCFASGAYGFGSLINHSCAPNIVRIYKGTTSYIFVLRPIKANGIILDNYGYHYATQPKQIRLKNLETQYRFTCNCEACENNFQLYHDLPVPPNVPEEISAGDIQKLMEHNRKFAFDNYKRFCDFLNNYAKFYPCAQLCSVEESLKMAYNILFHSIPLKAKIENE